MPWKKRFPLLIARLQEFFPNSVLVEFHRVFGEAATEKLLEVFSGVTLEVPSHQYLETCERDISIYEALCLSTSASQTRKLAGEQAKKHGLSHSRVRTIFRQIRKQMKENRRFKLADERIGQLKKGGIKVEHQSRRV